MFKKYMSYNFDKKVKIFISLAITVTTLCVLGISTFSSVKIVTEKSGSLAKIQMETLANDYQMNLSGYYDMAKGLMMDEHVKLFLKQKDRTEPELLKQVGQTIHNNLNVQSNINFIAIINVRTQEYAYKGKTSLAYAGLESKIQEDHRAGTLAKQGDVILSYADRYNNGEEYSMTLYSPLYDVNHVKDTLGMVCINIRGNLLEHMGDTDNAQMPLKIMMVHSSGEIFSAGDKSLLGTGFSCLENLRGEKGEFKKDNSLFVYRKMGVWNYYLVGKIPYKALYIDSFRTMAILCACIVMMVIAGISAGSRLVRYSYRVVEKVVNGMNRVSEGDLEHRITLDNTGEDFKQMEQGFNYMMERMTELVDRVKFEQHQAEQIRFNALQDQIKPHFLYNTLECIHWQATSKGNEQVSTMVKALANYYRLCLSRGKDIISLKQEISHIENYLTIQNLRYGSIIESEFRIEPDMYSLQIPKLTLQPLVENAIYHGIRIEDETRGKLVISAEVRGERAVISVSDSGSGMTAEEMAKMNASVSEFDENFGYGVRNVHKRIELFFGKGYGLFYKMNEEAGVTVEITLPAGTQKKEGEDHV
nr:sensor histidine kinase [uncultured Blautia sp.]